MSGYGYGYGFDYGFGDSYLLRDEFTTALPAGSVNGTAAEPGPGTRVVVDTGTILDIASGTLTMDGGTGYGDPGLWYGQTSISPGILLLGKIYCTGGIIGITWDNAQSGNTPTESIIINATPALVIKYATNTLVVGDVSNSVYYKPSIARRANGCFYFAKGGTQYTKNILVFVSASNTANSYYPSVVGWAAIAGSKADFLRIPQALYLPPPLSSDGMGSIFGLTDGLGHAEGIAGGLGAGGGGLTWIHAETWATAGGVVANTPVVGVEKLTNGNAELDANWTSYGTPATRERSNEQAHGGTYSQKVITNETFEGCILRNASLVAHNWYKAQVWVRSPGTPAIYFYLGQGDGDGTDPPYNNAVLVADTWTQLQITARASVTGTLGGIEILTNTAAPQTFYADDATVKPLPISTLITNQQLATTDVLAEMVISAYTLSTQAGLVQSDRPFAFLANANAASGQNIIVLKGVTNAIPDTDTITIKHPITPTTYTIASVSALVGGIQTLTLDTNLVEAVSANDKVGVNWASWNGTITYFDGAGNIKLGEVLAGVYTNRGSTATAFSANKRLIVRKVGSEYRIFYNETLVGTAITTVAAGAMVGTYWGLFSTAVSNTVTSCVFYDTGNVTNAHSILDRYSAD